MCSTLLLTSSRTTMPELTASRNPLRVCSRAFLACSSGSTPATSLAVELAGGDDAVPEGVEESGVGAERVDRVPYLLAEEFPGPFRSLMACSIFCGDLT